MPAQIDDTLYEDSVDTMILFIVTPIVIKKLNFNLTLSDWSTLDVWDG